MDIQILKADPFLCAACIHSLRPPAISAFSLRMHVLDSLITSKGTVAFLLLLSFR